MSNSSVTCFLLPALAVFVSPLHPLFAASIDMLSLLLLPLLLPGFYSCDRFFCLSVSFRTFGAFFLGCTDFLYRIRLRIRDLISSLYIVGTQLSFVT